MGETVSKTNRFSCLKNETVWKIQKENIFNAGLFFFPNGDKASQKQMSIVDILMRLTSGEYLGSF